jgi:prepilin-type N-terminal cleavage/methylation domain-containing protein
MKLTKNNKGFTIIEVLIVLAIAGLIMLVVFLAVPALQRNSRNTQRRNQVATYLGAVNEFMANNNGNVPSTAAHVTTVNGLAADGLLTEPTAVQTGTRSTAIGINAIELVTNARCDTATLGNTTNTGASPRNVAVRFAVEDSGGNPVPQCQEG